MEENIVYEGPHVYVYREGKRFEIRVLAGTHSVMIGFKHDREKAIILAQRLERYPDQLKAFAGIGGVA